MINFRKPLLFAVLPLLFLAIRCVNDVTSGQNNICSLHKIEMEKSTIKIVYGLPHESEFEERKASESLFPNGRNYLLGGCMPSLMEKEARIYLCPDCVEARAAWVKEKGYEKINTP